jgi:hypothetical protein
MADKTGFQFDNEGAWIAKDPNASKDYTLNFGPWLNGDVITAVAFDVPAGLTIENEGHTDTTAFIELSGGTLGKNYIINAHITCLSGNEEDKSFRLVIREN